MKMTWKTACMMSMVLGLMVVTQAAGQADEKNALEEKGKAGHQKICLASKVKEMTVKGESNQQVGKIEDLVIDATGQVQYLAIDLQAGAEIGSDAEAAKDAAEENPLKQPGAEERAAHKNAKLTLVPFEAAQFHEGEVATQNYVSLKNIDQDRLTQAPTFTREQLTSQQQRQWMAQVDKFFGREKSGAARPDLEDKAEEEIPDLEKSDLEDK